MLHYANGLRLGILAVVVYVAALTVGLRLFYYLAYVLTAVVAASFIWTHLSKSGITVRRAAEPRQANVGDTIRETIEVQNSSRLPKLWLEVGDRSTLPGHRSAAVVSLSPHARKRWQVRTRALKRGLYRTGPTQVVSGDPFGLFQAGILLSSSSEILVLPPVIPLTSFSLPSGDLQGGSQTKRRSLHSTPNAAGIREYRSGDAMNRIHWPATARVQAIMVREFDLDPAADIWLVADLFSDVQRISVSDVDGASHTGTGSTHLKLEPSTEEYIISLAASLGSHFLAQGRSVGLLAWGQHKVKVPADRGGRQLLKILRALAVLRAEGTHVVSEVFTSEERLFGRQDTVIVITPSLDLGWAAAFQTLRLRLANAVVMLVEPSTFGGEESSIDFVAALSGAEMPVYIIKRDDEINAALSQQQTGMARRYLG